jgi:DNA-binding XRE family transcriptional regulator
MPPKHIRPRDPLSDEIIRVRRALGEDQAQFAKRLGIARTSLVKYERYGPPFLGTARPYLEYALGRARQQLAMRKRRKQRDKASANL